MNQAQAFTRRRTFSQVVSEGLLHLSRWRVLGHFPDLPKYIVVGAPHTTNWDFYYLLLVKGVTGVDLRWIGKDSLFRWPLGSLMKWSGGIPVNRRSRNNFVDQMVDLFSQYDSLALSLTPEGTRSKVNYWKTGFYHMAVGAQVPIVLVAIDYPSRTIEIGPLLIPSGDIECDFGIIRKFYDGKSGKYPAKQGAIQLRPDQD